MPIIKLTPPRFSASHIKEKITCIRAHRERIFRIDTEIVHEKLICHNYGHGGAGWTFLFGSVNRSIRQMEQQVKDHAHLANTPICVIGAGCYGLLTAITLKEMGYQVRIVARDIENIQSDKAAGFFFPRHRKCSTPEEQAQFASVGIESYQEYMRIINGSHPFIAQGPSLLPAYFSPDIDPGFGPYVEKKLIEAPEYVTIDFGNGKTYDVIQYKIIFINPSNMMKELRKKIFELDIPIEKKHIPDFASINEKIVFNCSGLYAKELTHDPRLVPVQGHLITLQDQPDTAQLQYLINVKITMTTPKGTPRDELIYFAPKESGILGITFIRGQSSPTTNAHEFDRLLERCQTFFGS